jgi:hypothetical protein
MICVTSYTSYLTLTVRSLRCRLIRVHQHSYQSRDISLHHLVSDPHASQPQLNITKTQGGYSDRMDAFTTRIADIVWPRDVLTLVVLLITSTLLLTYLTTRFLSWRARSDNLKGLHVQPPLAPYAVPWLANTLLFAWDTEGYIWRMQLSSTLS